MAEVKVIGKVSATDHNPSTIDDFYFWTNAGELLSPFDIVQVNHLGDSITYGRIDSISHVTDSSSHLSSFISSDLYFLPRGSKISITVGTEVTSIF